MNDNDLLYALQHGIDGRGKDLKETLLSKDKEIEDYVVKTDNSNIIGFGQEINKPGIPIGDLLDRIAKLEHNLKNIETILNNLLEAKNE